MHGSYYINHWIIIIILGSEDPPHRVIKMLVYNNIKLLVDIQLYLNLQVYCAKKKDRNNH